MLQCPGGGHLGAMERLGLFPLALSRLSYLGTLWWTIGPHPLVAGGRTLVVQHLVAQLSRRAVGPT